mmetsp:Transcript_17937/g.39767  ORF Transcript_17937/g.39767 Transcript_17937/m.39767 type:complete len:295 (+) Transcript_17937:134-1018(+)
MMLKSGRAVSAVPAKVRALPRLNVGHFKQFAESDSDKENVDPCSEDDEHYPITQPKVAVEDRAIVDLVMEFQVHEDFRAAVDEYEAPLIPATTTTAQVALANFEALFNPDSLEDDYVTDFAEASDIAVDYVDDFHLHDDPILQPGAAALRGVPEGDWGQRPDSVKGPVWHRYLHKFPSAPKYISVVDHFLCFQEAQDNCCEETLSENVGKYFEHERDVNKRKSSTLRSRFSALKIFFLHTGRREITKEQTLVESNFAKWNKVDTTKQSAVFLKEHYGTYFFLQIQCTPLPTHFI